MNEWNYNFYKWMNEWMSEWMNEWMNEWINEWMNEIFNGFVTQPYFSKYIILKRTRKSQQYLYLYRIRFMPTIILGIMIFMNEFDFSTTP